MKFADLITNPAWGYQLLETYDLKAAHTGHSYSDADRKAGLLRKAYLAKNEPCVD